MARQPKVTAARTDRLLRLLSAAAGIAAPLVMWIVWIVAGLQHRDYRLYVDPASALGQVGAQGGAAFNAGFFIVPGLLIIAFSIRLYAAIPRRGLGTAGVLAIGTSGLSLLLSGLISTNPNSPQLSLLHRMVGLPLLTTLPAGLLLLSLALRHRAGWSRCRRLSLTVGSVMALLIATYEVPWFGLPDGIFQRVSLLLLTIWFVTIGGVVLRRPGGAGVARQPGDTGYGPPLERGTRETPAAWRLMGVRRHDRGPAGNRWLGDDRRLTHLQGRERGPRSEKGSSDTVRCPE